MKNLIVKTSSSIKESLFKLEHNQEKCLIVIDEKGYYKGTLNDGDVRRAILLGANINSKIKKYVKKNSFYLKEKDLEKKENVEIIQLINNLKKEKIDISATHKSKFLQKPCNLVIPLFFSFFFTVSPPPLSFSPLSSSLSQ